MGNKGIVFAVATSIAVLLALWYFGIPPYQEDGAPVMAFSGIEKEVLGGNPGCAIIDKRSYREMLSGFFTSSYTGRRVTDYVLEDCDTGAFFAVRYYWKRGMLRAVPYDEEWAQFGSREAANRAITNARKFDPLFRSVLDGRFDGYAMHDDLDRILRCRDDVFGAIDNRQNLGQGNRMRAAVLMEYDSDGFADAEQAALELWDAGVKIKDELEEDFYSECHVIACDDEAVFGAIGLGVAGWDGYELNIFKSAGYGRCEFIDSRVFRLDGEGTPDGIMADLLASSPGGWQGHVFSIDVGGTDADGSPCIRFSLYGYADLDDAAYAVETEARDSKAFAVFDKIFEENDVRMEARSLPGNHDFGDSGWTRYYIIADASDYDKAAACVSALDEWLESDEGIIGNPHLSVILFEDSATYDRASAGLLRAKCIDQDFGTCDSSFDAFDGGIGGEKGSECGVWGFGYEDAWPAGKAEESPWRFSGKTFERARENVMRPEWEMLEAAFIIEMEPGSSGISVECKGIRWDKVNE